MGLIPTGLSGALNYGKKKVGFRTDPYTGFNFHVEIDGLIVGGFSEISGLSMSTKVESIQEGGSNNGAKVFPSQTTYTNLVLSRGISDVDMMYGWYKDVISGHARRRNMTIFLLDENSLPITWWDIINAVPIGWDGPSLNASQAGVATEKITIAYERFERPLVARAASTVRNLGTGVAGLF